MQRAPLAGLPRESPSWRVKAPILRRCSPFGSPGLPQPSSPTSPSPSLLCQSLIYLLRTIPAAADSGIVYWALILGADLSGNATYLGSAPNIVAVGLLAQTGYRLSFGRFLRDGLPVTAVTLLLSSIYLILRY